MKENKKRGLLASATALVAAAALALGGSAAANAEPLDGMPANSPVTITKLEQPAGLGDPATGEEMDDLAGYTGIGGVIFDYYLVPDIDLGTNAGQATAAGLTLADVSDDTNTHYVDLTGSATGSFDPTNSPSGVTGKTLDRGLYLVVERASSVPAGVTAAAPFLLPVPLTNPSDLDKWLDHIYIYPKNSKVGGTKTVVNADQLVVGDGVTWTIETDIPLVPNPDYDSEAEAEAPEAKQFIAPDAYRIDDTLNDDELELVGDPVVKIGTTTLAKDTHYTVTPDTSVAGKTTYQIKFINPAGLDALAAAVNDNPNAKVEITLVTKVLKADEISNSADFYPNQNAITQNKPIEVPKAEIKYGSFGVQKLSTLTGADLAGAEFRVYGNEADALAANNDYLTITTPNADPTEDPVETNLWTTDTNGQFVIEGLRYSEFANGSATNSTTNNNEQTYWLVEVTALDGHQLLAEPLEFSVDEDSSGYNFEVTNVANTGGFELPLTGGTGTWFILAAGGVLLAIVLLVGSRRRKADAAA